MTKNEAILKAQREKDTLNTDHEFLISSLKSKGRGTSLKL